MSSELNKEVASDSTFQNLMLKNRILEYMVHHPVDKVIVTLHGGEPTLSHRSTFEMLTELYNGLFKDRIFYHIQSNLISIPDYVLKWINICNVKVSTSIDGPPNVQEMTRGYSKKQIGNIENNIKLLTSFDNGKIGAVCVLTSNNINNPKDILSYVQSIGVNIRFNIGYVDNQPLVPYENYFEFLQYIALNRHLYNDIGIQPVDRHLQLIFDQSNSEHPTFCNELSNCGEYYMAIDLKGQAYPCGRFYSEKQGKLGNIYDDKLDDLYFINKTYQSQLKSDLCCNSCDYRKLCGSMCLHQAIKYDNDTLERHCKAFANYANSIIDYYANQN